MRAQLNKTFLILVLLFAFLQISAQQSDSLIIQTVTINRSDVFPDTTKAIYRAANTLHPITKDKVIRRRILFKEGDVLDMELITETERILRNLLYLEGARITIDTSETGVDITIYTHDAWSFLIVGDFGTGGGLTTVGLGIEEYNLLGLGKHYLVYNEWTSDIGNTWLFVYDDQQLFGSQWQAYFDYETGPVSNNFLFVLQRPYFSSDSPWDFGGSYSNIDQIDRLFDNGIETSRLQYLEQSFDIDVERRFGKRYQKFGVSLGYDYKDRQFKEIEGQTHAPLPQDELINRLSLDLSKEKLKFTEDIRIKKMVVTEDIRLGPKFGIGLSKTGFFGSKGVDRWEYYFAYDQNWQFGKSTYFGLTAAYTTKQTRDEIYSASLEFYSRLAKNHTLAFQMSGAYSDNLESGSQFLLGGESGLRGYPARFIGGDVYFLSNIEDRIFTGFQFLGMELGGVAFFDVGYVWKIDAPVIFSDLLPSVGIGIRICMYAYPGAAVLRIDYGIPLNDNAPNIAIGFGQQF